MPEYKTFGIWLHENTSPSVGILPEKLRMTDSEKRLRTNITVEK